MKWLILMMLMAMPIVLAEENTYAPNEIINLPVYLTDMNGEVNGANCNIRIQDQDFNLIEQKSMIENGQGWYDANFTTGTSGYYYCTQNCTYMGNFVAGDCNFIVEGEAMSPEAIQIWILAFSFIIAIILFILALYKEDAHIAYGSGFLFCMIGLYIFANGFANLGNSNNLTYTLATISSGLGVLILWRAVVADLDNASGGK